MRRDGVSLLAVLSAAVVAHALFTNLFLQPSTSKLQKTAASSVEPGSKHGEAAAPTPTHVALRGNAEPPTIKSNAKQLDIGFCIDTTGSMSGEIEAVKNNVADMVEALKSKHPNASVRVGLVAYRDKGDDYVTKIFPLSSNISEVRQQIRDLSADGGGDGPEAVDCGIHEALHSLHWNPDKKTPKVLFLIGDAPPHEDRHDYDVQTELAWANDNNIRISTIACNGLETYGVDGVPLFKKIATMTNGNFQMLAYHQEIADASGHMHTIVTSGGVAYAVKAEAKDKWKTESAETLVASGLAAPALQGATNGSIGPQGIDGTVISGVNTAGTVRSDNNLGSLVLDRVSDVFSK
ncbi:MAG TPA: vWA domain-containing protein [Candidatus Obscuribacterales bacterium]